MIEAAGWAAVVDSHSGAIGTFLGGLGATMAMILREWWNDHKTERALHAESEARTETTSLLRDSIELLRKDLGDREKTERDMHDILTRFAVSLESLVQNWRSHSAEFKLVREDIREFISKGNGITEAGS